MTITPYNADSYLVESRTNPEDSYIVDVIELSCSCPAAMDFNTRDALNPCAHLTAALAFHYAGRAIKAVSGSPLAFLKCKTI